VSRKIPIARPATGEDEWQALRAPLVDGWLTQGPRVAEFERAFAARHGTAHAIACTSGTTGLHLALAALGIGPGDEVIVPSFTFVATANAVVASGAIPVLCDVDPRTFNLDAAHVAAKRSYATRAIVAVHLFGLCADVEAIAVAAPGIPIVEDAACAAGAAHGSRPAGSMGTAGVFSFHPRKTITTGEGGMITTNDPALADRAASLRNHGGTPSEAERQGGPSPHLMPDFDQVGFNYRMTDLQAAVGLVQLAKLDAFVAERSRLAAAYRNGLGDLPWLRLPDEPANGRHGWQSFVAWVDEARAPLPRNALMQALAARGIATRPGTHAIHLLGAYRDRFGLRPDDLPGARDAAAFSLALPLHNRMSDDDQAYVIDALRALSRPPKS